MNVKIQNTSELNKQCADKNTLSAIVIRLFNVFDLKSIIKSIGFEKPNSRSVCSLLHWDQDFLITIEHYQVKISLENRHEPKLGALADLCSKIKAETIAKMGF